jgi:hypothetical protein
MDVVGMDVVGLVGTWSVTVADDDPAILVLHPRGFELRVGAGIRFGSWRADAGDAFVAHVTSAGAAHADLSTPGWLERSSRVGPDGARLVLRDAAGAVTARLDRVAPPPTVPDHQFLRPAEPLPAGPVPVERALLVGRWEPSGGTGAPRRPHVLFEDGGRWSGSDGCNGAGGRWTCGAGGVLLATVGPTTAMACADMVPVPGWIAWTRRAGLDGDTLVLLDADGRELGRLHRAAVP